MKKIFILLAIFSVIFIFADGNIDEIRQKMQERINYFEKAKTPYVFGGKSTAGIDCSGLVTDIYKNAGVTYPVGCITMGGASGMYNAFENKITKVSDLKPGDAIFFNRNRDGKTGIGHVGIVVSDPNNECKGGVRYFHTNTSKPPKNFPHYRCGLENDGSFAGGVSLEDVVNANGKPQTGECDNTQQNQGDPANDPIKAIHNTSASSNPNEIDYTRPNFIDETNTGLQVCSLHSEEFLRNLATATCKWCSNCVSQATPQQISNAPFQTINEIKANIEEAQKTMKKIIKLQGEKTMAMASNQSKIEAMNMKLEEQKYNMEKSVKLQCINADYQINQLNAQISMIEKKLSQIANK